MNTDRTPNTRDKRGGRSRKKQVMAQRVEGGRTKNANVRKETRTDKTAGKEQELQSRKRRTDGPRNRVRESR